MPSKLSDFFQRVEYIVDTHYEGNITAFAKDVGITRQYYTKMRQQSRGEVKGEPNPSLDKILTIVEKTGVNPAWLLTGVGEPEGSQEVTKAFHAVAEDDSRLRDLSKSDIPLDERTEFVAKQLELLIKMLRNPEKLDDESET